jgi:hypothetical protein
MIKMEREREEKRRMKDLRAKQARQRREARKKKFMDAAYEGQLAELNFLISDLERELDNEQEEGAENKKQESNSSGKRKEVELVALCDCRDRNGNTALSEAASGGSLETVYY